MTSKPRNKIFHACQLWSLSTSLLLCATGLMAAQNEGLSSNPKNVVLKTIPCKASQGVAVGEKYFYAISNTTITKHDKATGKLIASWQADKKKKAYEHFKHLNSGTVIGGRLYCAHSRYSIDPNANTVEIWHTEKKKLEHEETIHMPRKHGSFTWIDRHRDGSWWMCYAVYGGNKNSNTKLVKYQYENKKFIEVESWSFPKEVIAHWGSKSCSGGSWGPDGYLYATGHDHAQADVLEIDAMNKLKYVRTESGVGFFGQAIAWDRSSKRPILWGIVKNKNISLTLIPNAEKQP